MDRCSSRIAQSLDGYASTEDIERIVMMSRWIMSRDWCEANACITAWSMEDCPDWGEIPDLFINEDDHAA